MTQQLVNGGFKELCMDVDKSFGVKILNPAQPSIEFYHNSKKVLTLSKQQFDSLCYKIPKINSGFSFLLEEDQLVQEFNNLIQYRQQQLT